LKITQNEILRIDPIDQIKMVYKSKISSKEEKNNETISLKKLTDIGYILEQQGINLICEMQRSYTKFLMLQMIIDVIQLMIEIKKEKIDKVEEIEDLQLKQVNYLETAKEVLMEGINFTNQFEGIRQSIENWYMILEIHLCAAKSWYFGIHYVITHFPSINLHYQEYISQILRNIQKYLLDLRSMSSSTMCFRNISGRISTFSDDVSQFESISEQFTEITSIRFDSTLNQVYQNLINQNCWFICPKGHCNIIPIEKENMIRNCEECGLDLIKNFSQLNAADYETK
jgi:hypothetical protein